jgi:hypothetical protein
MHSIIANIHGMENMCFDGSYVYSKGDNKILQRASILDTWI